MMLTRCNVVRIWAFVGNVRRLYHEREVGYMVTRGSMQVTPTLTGAINEQSWTIRLAFHMCGHGINPIPCYRYKTILNFAMFIML